MTQVSKIIRNSKTLYLIPVKTFSNTSITYMSKSYL